MILETNRYIRTYLEDDVSHLKFLKIAARVMDLAEVVCTYLLAMDSYVATYNYCMVGNFKCFNLYATLKIACKF